MDENNAVLGGVRYRRVMTSTLEHDHWSMGQIRRAGLDRVAMREGELPDEFVRRLLDEVVTTGSLYPLLGAFLIPAEIPDESWTPEIAAETAQRMRVLTDPAEKQQVHQLTVTLLIGFFLNGLAIAKISQASSIEAPELAASESESHGNAATTTLATGHASSASWRATTSAAIKRFFAGLFGKR